MSAAFLFDLDLGDLGQPDFAIPKKVILAAITKAFQEQKSAQTGKLVWREHEIPLKRSVDGNTWEMPKIEIKFAQDEATKWGENMETRILVPLADTDMAAAKDTMPWSDSESRKGFQDFEEKMEKAMQTAETDRIQYDEHQRLAIDRLKEKIKRTYGCSVVADDGKEYVVNEGNLIKREPPKADSGVRRPRNSADDPPMLHPGTHLDEPD